MRWDDVGGGKSSPCRCGATTHPHPIDEADDADRDEDYGHEQKNKDHYGTGQHRLTRAQLLLRYSRVCVKDVSSPARLQCP